MNCIILLIDKPSLTTANKNKRGFNSSHGYKDKDYRKKDELRGTKKGKIKGAPTEKPSSTACVVNQSRDVKRQNRREYLQKSNVSTRSKCHDGIGSKKKTKGVIGKGKKSNLHNFLFHAIIALPTIHVSQLFIDF